MPHRTLGSDEASDGLLEIVSVGFANKSLPVDGEEVKD